MRGRVRWGLSRPGGSRQSVVGRSPSRLHHEIRTADAAGGGRRGRITPRCCTLSSHSQHQGHRPPPPRSPPTRPSTYRGSCLNLQPLTLGATQPYVLHTHSVLLHSSRDFTASAENLLTALILPFTGSLLGFPAHLPRRCGPARITSCPISLHRHRLRRRRAAGAAEFQKTSAVTRRSGP